MTKKINYSITETPNGYVITPLKTPAGNPVIVPTSAMANHVVNLLNQGNKITPYLQLLYTALDLPTAPFIARIMATLRHDALLFCPTEPPELRTYIESKIRPCLVTYGKRMQVALALSPDLTAPPIPEILFSQMQDHLEHLSPFACIVFHEITSLLGSAILTFMLLEDMLSVEAAYELSQVEASYQREKWGTTQIHLDADAEIIAELKQCMEFYRDTP